MHIKKERKIKITHVSRFAYPYIGGIEAVIEQINESLPNQEFEKEVICCSNTDESSIKDGVKYTRCKYLFDFAANSISPMLFFKLMFYKTDIIHFHMPVIQNLVIWFILYHLGLLKYRKLIISYHGAIIGYDKFMKPFWPLYRYFYKKADKIHVLSPNVIECDSILTPYREKCEIIPYGIDVDVEVKEEEVKKIKEQYKNKKIILCCGRLVKFKGFQYVIEAMKNIENAVLLIMGDGPLMDTFKIYIEENNLKDKVFLLGSISDKKQKEIYYQACDIFILSSIHTSESFGIVQLEAMRCSKPVINTNLGTGVNYISIDGVTGFVVEPENVKQLENTINKLVQDKKLRNFFGQNARKRICDIFSYDKVKEKYRFLYLG